MSIRACTLLFLLTLPAVLPAADTLSVRDNLLRRPPFGETRPAVTRPAEAVPANVTELRGIFGRGEACQVSLRRGGPTGETRWLKVGESHGPWRVVRVSPELREAVVEVDGALQTLSLAKSDAAPIPVVSPVPTNAEASGPITSPAIAAPTFGSPPAATGVIPEAAPMVNAAPQSGGAPASSAPVVRPRRNR